MSLSALPFRTQARCATRQASGGGESPGTSPSPRDGGLSMRLAGLGGKAGRWTSDLPGGLRLPLALLSFVCLAATGMCADVPLKDQPHLRRPVASAWMEEGKLLAVANRCGSVSIVDVPSQKAIEEIRIGERLAD